MARSLARKALVALALAAPAALAQPSGSSGQLFSTTLHGAPQETIEPGTPGATTLQLQEWLTEVDPDVRGVLLVLVALCSPTALTFSVLTSPTTLVPHALCLPRVSSLNRGNNRRFVTVRASAVRSCGP